MQDRECNMDSLFIMHRQRFLGELPPELLDNPFKKVQTREIPSHEPPKASPYNFGARFAASRAGVAAGNMSARPVVPKPYAAEMPKPTNVTIDFTGWR